MSRYFLDRVLGTGLAMSLVLVGAVVAQQASDVKSSPSLGAGAGAGQDKASARRPVRAEDYGPWETLGPMALSPDGRWLAYGISRTDGERELRVRMLATEATETIPHGTGPRFSKDAKWLAYTIGVSEAEREKAEKTKDTEKTKDAEKTKDTPRTKLGLRNLVSGGMSTVDDVASVAFNDDGKYLLMRRYPIKGRESAGVDLVVRDLATGVDTSFGNVASYKFNDKGTLLALAIDAEGKVGNGVQVYDAATGMLRTLDSSAARYTALTWRKDASDLAVLRENDHAKDEDASFVALSWRGLGQKLPKKAVYDFSKDESFSKDLRVVDFAGLNWSDDGQTVFFGVKKWENRPAPKTKKDESKKDESKQDEPKKNEDKKAADKAGAKKSLRATLKEPAGVEVWHAKDVEIIPYQMKNAERKKRESFRAAWWVDDGKFVQLGNDLTEDIVLVEGQKHAIGLDNTPHEVEKKFGPTLHDIYLIDVKTGDRKKVLDRLKYSLGSSPDGRYLLYLRDKNVWTYDMTAGTHANLTGDLGVSFINDERVTLTDEKPAYGVGGWTKDGKHLLLYDRFDIWDLTPDGQDAKRLTDGRKDQVVHRWLRFDFEDDGDRYVRLDRPMYLSLDGETSKNSGFAILRPGEKLETLVWKPRNVGRLERAKDADVFAYVEQDYDDSPDIFVAGPDLKDSRQVSQTNPFQKDFLWGRSELVDYTSADGEALQAALIYPADYEPGKTYPMIVYIYERLSPSLHVYSAPTERSPYNPTVFSAEGYFVLMPDIVYRPQNPGLSAVECVVPAVKIILFQVLTSPCSRCGLAHESYNKSCLPR